MTSILIINLKMAGSSMKKSNPISINDYVAERDIQKSILEWLNLTGFFVWRMNVGAATYTDKHGKSHQFRFGFPGISDIIGLCPNGRFIAVEVKKPKGKGPTIDQLTYIDIINKHGGIGMVARSLEDVQDRLKKELF